MWNFPSEPPNWCIPPDDGPQPPEVEGEYFIEYGKTTKDGTPCAVVGYAIDECGISVSGIFGVLIAGNSRIAEEYGEDLSVVQKKLYLVAFSEDEPLINVKGYALEEGISLVSESLKDFEAGTVNVEDVVKRLCSEDFPKITVSELETLVWEDFAEQWEPEDLSGGPEDGPDPWDEAYW